MVFKRSGDEDNDKLRASIEAMRPKHHSREFRVSSDDEGGKGEISMVPRAAQSDDSSDGDDDQPGPLFSFDDGLGTVAIGDVNSTKGKSPTACIGGCSVQ
jgi:hypothetical protein